MFIILAVFAHVFLLDPSLNSTFAQKQSCRSSLSLQLLFWPNFKFLYEILSFNKSKSCQNRLNVSLFSPVLHCAHPDAHTGDALTILAIRAAPSLSRARDPIRSSSPFFFLVRELSRAQAEPPPSSAPTTPRHPASIRRALSRAASPFTSSTHP